MAMQNVESKEYWFRTFYKVSPKSQEYLQMTELEIEIEFESYLCSKGEKIKKCVCGQKTFQKICPSCGKEILTSDEDFNDTFDKIVNGLKFKKNAKNWRDVE